MEIILVESPKYSTLPPGTNEKGCTYVVLEKAQDGSCLCKVFKGRHLVGMADIDYRDIKERK